MEKVTYGFKERDIALLADSLSKILQIHLYSHQSPMRGPWYSSQDLNASAQAVKQALKHHDFDTIAEINRATEEQPLIELELNDPDPYYIPIFPDEKVKCVLRVRENQAELRDMENKLRASGLHYIELKREGSEK